MATLGLTFGSQLSSEKFEYELNIKYQEILVNVPKCNNATYSLSIF